MSSIPSYRPRGLDTVTALTTGILILFTAVTVLSIIAGLFELSGLLRIRSGALFTEAQVATIDGARTLTNLLQVLVLYVLCLPIVVTWIYMAHVGTIALGVHDKSFSPFASVAWFAVPIAFLWMPYRAMRELWKASTDPVGWRGVVVPRVVGAWWLCWVLYMVVNRAGRSALAGSDTVEGYVLTSLLMGLSDVLVAAAAIFLIAVVRGVKERQGKWFAIVKSERSATEGSELAADLGLPNAI